MPPRVPSPGARHRAAAWLAAAAAGCAATSAAAQVSPPGRLLASNCFQCHGTSGKGLGFDRLAGKSARELVEELREFRAGKEGDGLMTRHALGYTDAQLQALAGWLSRQR